MSSQIHSSCYLPAWHRINLEEFYPNSPRVWELFQSTLFAFVPIPDPVDSSPNEQVHTKLIREEDNKEWKILQLFLLLLYSRTFDLCIDSLPQFYKWNECFRVTLLCHTYHNCRKIGQLCWTAVGPRPAVSFCITLPARGGSFPLWLPSAGLSFFSSESSINTSQPHQQKREDLSL